MVDFRQYQLKFVQESRERLDAAENELLILEQHPEDDQALRRLKREFHTLKGAATMLGFSGIASLTHQLEDFFEERLSGSSPELGKTHVDGLLRVVDVLRQTLAEVETDGSEDSLTEEQVTALWASLEAGPVVSSRPEPLAEAPRTMSFSKASLMAQLGVAPPLITVSEEVSEEPPPFVPPAAAEPVERPRSAGPSVEESPNVASLVSKKRDERLLQNEIKVSADVIDKLTRDALETSFQVLQLESLVQGFKRLQRQFSRFHLEQQGPTDPSRDRAAWSDHWQKRRDEEALLLHHLQQLTEKFQGAYDVLNATMGELNDAVLESKLISVGQVFNTLPRYVRDLGQLLKKEISFSISGQHTKLDKGILLCLNEALIHMIRNAVDHGLETAEERLAKGKPAKGHLSVDARTKGNRVQIVVRDDGRGIDVAKVKKKALEKKLVSQEKSGDLTKRDWLEFIFLSGFSTTDLTTDLSGRGVGMDVVRKNINKFNGRIDVDTETDAYTTFTLTLPTAMSTSLLLVVSVAGQDFGLPLEFLSQIRPLTHADLMVHQKKLSLIDGTSILEVVDIGQYLGLREEVNPSGDGFLLHTTLKDNLWLLVDQVEGQKYQVVKKFDDFMGKPMFSTGATQLEDGRTVVVLDVFDLVSFKGKTSRLRHESAKSEGKTRRILLVDDSAMTREIEAGILRDAGYLVETAVDGVEALERLSGGDVWDLLVTDIEMPRMDGFQLAEHVRKAQALAGLPLIMVTSLAKPSDRLKGLSVGANAYLTKQGLAKGLLLETVRQLIGGVD
jgi:chemotaxis protein histidine kinase CheA